MNIQHLLAQNPLQGTITGPGAFQPVLSGSASQAAGSAFEQFFSVFLGFFTLIGGLMFLLYFIFGGLTWLSAGGEKGKAEAARTQLTNAAIGLIIVILAQFIVAIAGGVLGLKILDPVAVLGTLFKH
ncbi:MAG TPA: hypothetical protein VFG51_03390 [Candidatus Saccharimonadia bacterium]|nr:hypothetical protein [Candidatus Saccharimonadia bacterium]